MIAPILPKNMNFLATPQKGLEFWALGSGLYGGGWWGWWRLVRLGSGLWAGMGWVLGLGPETGSRMMS